MRFSARKEIDISLFKHVIIEKVKFHEVDMMQVVNNAVYLNYFEDARVKYLQDLKSNYQLEEMMEGDSFFIMARNEIDYLYPAAFDDELTVYIKIEWIKNLVNSFAVPVVKWHHSIAFLCATGFLIFMPSSRKWELYELAFGVIFFLIFLL